MQDSEYKGRRIIGKIQKITDDRIIIKGSPFIYILDKKSDKQIKLLNIVAENNWDIHLYIRKKVGPFIFIRGFNTDRWKATRKKGSRLHKALAENYTNMVNREVSETHVDTKRKGFHTGLGNFTYKK